MSFCYCRRRSSAGLGPRGRLDPPPEDGLELFEGLCLCLKIQKKNEWVGDWRIKMVIRHRRQFVEFIFTNIIIRFFLW